jgi:hypothetical protein
VASIFEADVVLATPLGEIVLRPLQAMCQQEVRDDVDGRRIVRERFLPEFSKLLLDDGIHL